MRRQKIQISTAVTLVSWRVDSSACGKVLRKALCSTLFSTLGFRTCKEYDVILMVPSCEGRVVCIAGPLGFGTPHCLERLHLSRDSLRFTGQFWGFKFYQCDCHNCRTCLGDSDSPFSWSMRNTSQVRLWSQHCGIKRIHRSALQGHQVSLPGLSSSGP